MSNLSPSGHDKSGVSLAGILLVLAGASALIYFLREMAFRSNDKKLSEK